MMDSCVLTDLLSASMSAPGRKSARKVRSATEPTIRMAATMAKSQMTRSRTSSRCLSGESGTERADGLFHVLQLLKDEGEVHRPRTSLRIEEYGVGVAACIHEPVVHGLRGGVHERGFEYEHALRELLEFLPDGIVIHGGPFGLLAGERATGGRRVELVIRVVVASAGWGSPGEVEVRARARARASHVREGGARVHLTAVHAGSEAVGVTE